MSFREINQENVANFVYQLLNYFNTINICDEINILDKNNDYSIRNNVGWYQYVGSKHKLFINIPNILLLKKEVYNNNISTDDFYVFVALVVIHEYRHLMQGKCIFDGDIIDGFSKKDAFDSQLIMYIRYFFDAYYILNKGNIKYEEDAERFAIKKTLDFFKNNYPNVNIENSLISVINYYSKLQLDGGIVPTLPINCSNTYEVFKKIDANIANNYRIDDLKKTLRVFHPKFYSTHIYYGLNEELLYNDEIQEKYSSIQKGDKKDLFIVEEILKCLEKPSESLDEFPGLKKKYIKY